MQRGDDKYKDAAREFDKAIASPRALQHYRLRLYVTGSSPRSARAISNLKNLCEEHLKDHYELEVIDIYQQPTKAKDEQIIAAPTLVKQLPHPLRKFVGDLSDSGRILMGLDIRPLKNP